MASICRVRPAAVKKNGHTWPLEKIFGKGKTEIRYLARCLRQKV
jgi:hypothetical protein